MHIKSVILANTSLILSNDYFSITEPKPYYPDVIDVGGIHSRPAKPVPKVSIGIHENETIFLNLCKITNYISVCFRTLKILLVNGKMGLQFSVWDRLSEV